MLLSPDDFTTVGTVRQHADFSVGAGGFKPGVESDARMSNAEENGSVANIKRD